MRPNPTRIPTLRTARRSPAPRAARTVRRRTGCQERRPKTTPRAETPTSTPTPELPQGREPAAGLGAGQVEGRARWVAREPRLGRAGGGSGDPVDHVHQRFVDPDHLAALHAAQPLAPQRSMFGEVHETASMPAGKGPFHRDGATYRYGRPR